MAANQDATFRIYQNVGYQAIDTVPVQIGTFRIYENVGYQGVDDVPTQEATFRIYENVGFLNDATLAATGTAESYLNAGIEPLTSTKDTTTTSYENIGFAPSTQLTIIRPPQGWGVIPTGPQTIVLFDKSSAGTAEAYENIQ